ncbi:HDOD domain-containing protein [Ectothiorhodospiraceae bacterium BW-2]|nr:HDOD domain-containing protein [Ectothiorhodospiraceae bacterium BW-2]
MEKFFVGRQPIFNRKQQVVAYELLYRAKAGADSANVIDGDKATSQVIVNSLFDIGLEHLVGESVAFINLTDSFIRGDMAMPFNHRQVVLEMLENVEPTAEALAGMKKLAAQKFTLALDDFIYRPEFDPFLELAHIVKLEVMNLSKTELAARIAPLKKFKVKLLAEKVETQQEYQDCLELGFSMFQGYFLCKPQLVEGRRLAPNKMVLLNLMSKVQNPDIEMGQLEELIVQDVSLSYRLLKLINSANFGLRHEIESIAMALSLLGLKAVRNWVSLIMLSHVDDKPPELLKIAIFRARLCEQIGKLVIPNQIAQCFTVGLFSLLEAMMDQPLKELLQELPLANDIKLALLDPRVNLQGNILQLVVLYESGRWAEIELLEGEEGCVKLSRAPKNRQLKLDELQRLYLEAIEWSELQMQQFK